MWIGSIKWNISIASIVGILTFLFSVMNNLLLESLLRSLLAFFLFFMLTFIFRFLAGKIIGKQHRDLFVSEERGQHIDLVTPEESAHQQSEGKKGGSESDSGGFAQFTSTDFPHIARTDKEKVDPEEVARALRVFSNE
ncbi:hypothetical protein [Aneurinibacillus sp. REN35]|uniref:hypothetical protein n=1 Tax=Aneurinibacillus sp. REN35 TaxID=3237286 RepID=UPI003527D5A6